MRKTPIEKRGNFLIIHDIPSGVRSAIAIPLMAPVISVETGVEIWVGSANTMTVAGWTIDEILDLIEGPDPVRRAVPAEVEFDAEEITRIADAAIDAMAKRQPKAVPLPLITRNEDDGEGRRGISLRELQTSVHDLAREKGWWDGYDRDDLGWLKLTTDQLLAKVSLIHAELSEAVEEARKSNDHGMYLGEGGKPEGFVVELADAVIRTLDLCGALGLDLEAAIVAKHEFNKTRPRRHGGKLA